MAYQAPLNGGRINATIGGNTAGAGALISTGTMFLAGGNNITLSQNANSLTISGANAGGGAAISAAGASASNGTVVFSASNGVGFGMNGSTITASHNGITSQTNQTVGFSAGGNTSLTSTGTFDARSMRLNGLGAVSVGFSNSSVFVSAPTQTVQTQGMQSITLAGNSTSAGAGYAQISSGQMTLAGGNNITLSQNGNAVTIAGGAGGGGVALLAGGSTFSSGSLSLSNAGGALTMATGAGPTLSFSVPATSSLSATGILSIATNGGTVSMGVPAMFDGGALGAGAGGTTAGTMGTNSNGLFLYAGSNIALSQSTDANGASVTISTPNAAGGGAATGSYYDNLIQQASVQAITYTSLTTQAFNRLLVQPLDPTNDDFPFYMTISTMYMNFSNSASATSANSAAHSSTYYIGLYTRVNSTQLSLVNSVSTSVGMSANTNNSVSYNGARWLSFHSSIFSSQPALDPGVRYYFGFMARTAGTYYASNSLGGMHYGQSVQRSGFMGTAASSHTSFNAWHPFMGVHSVTTHTVMPGTIANADINKASSLANFIPQLVFNGGGGLVN